MAQSGSYKFSITALDQASGVIENINKKLATMQAPVNRFNRALETFGDRSGIRKVMEEFNNLGRGVLSVTGHVAKLVEGLGLVGSIGTAAGIAQVVNHFATMGAEITSTAAILGMGTDRLAKWITMAKLAGGSAEDITKTFQSLEQLQRNIFVNPNQHPDEVRLNQSTFHINKDDTPEVMYQKMAKVLQTLSPAAQQKIRELTGMSSNLTRLEATGGIEKYGKEAEKYAPTKEEVENGEKVNQATLTLKASVDKLWNSIVSIFGPDIVKITEKVTSLMNTIGQALKPQLTKWAQDFSTWLDTIKPEDITKMVQSVINTVGGLPGLVSKIKIALEVIAAYMAINAVGNVAGSLLKIGGLARVLLGLGGAGAGGAAAAGGLGALAIGGIAAGGLALSSFAGNELSPAESLMKSGETLLSGTQKDDFLTRFSKWIFGNDTNVLSHWLLGSAMYSVGATLKARENSGGGGSSPSSSSSSSSAPSMPASDGTRVDPSILGSATGGLYGQHAADVAEKAGIDLAGLETSRGLPHNILAGIWQHETRGSLDPKIKNKYSSATGAFQFIDKTAEHYHVDRSSPADSARGAADYLAYLTNFFHGDSRKALAAYGAGEGTIRDLVKTYGDQWDQHLPSEAGDLLRKVGPDLNRTATAGVRPSVAGKVQIDINHNNPDNPETTVDTKASGDAVTLAPGKVVTPMPADMVS